MISLQNIIDILAKYRRFIVLIGAYGTVVSFTFLSPEPEIMAKANRPSYPFLREGLFSGTDRGYIKLGTQYEPYKLALPNHGVVSFITCRPYKNFDEERNTFWNAQHHLIPLLISPEPGQTRAIVYCDDDAAAEKKFVETGYKWLLKMAPGQGVAEKIT